MHLVLISTFVFIFCTRRKPSRSSPRFLSEQDIADKQIVSLHHCCHSITLSFRLPMYLSLASSPHPSSTLKLPMLPDRRSRIDSEGSSQVFSASSSSGFGGGVNLNDLEGFVGIQPKEKYTGSWRVKLAENDSRRPLSPDKSDSAHTLLCLFRSRRAVFPPLRVALSTTLLRVSPKTRMTCSVLESLR